MHKLDDRRVEALLVQSGFLLNVTPADRLFASAESFQRRQDRFTVVGKDPGVSAVRRPSPRWR